MLNDLHGLAVSHYYTLKDCQSKRKEIRFRVNYNPMHYIIDESGVKFHSYTLNIDSELRQLEASNKKLFLKYVLNRYATIITAKPTKSARK